MRKSSYRGVVDVVYGGQKGEEKEGGEDGKGKGKMKQNGKRKAEDDEQREEVEKPLSKREMKRRAKKARMERAMEAGDEKDKLAGASVKAATDVNVAMIDEKDDGALFLGPAHNHRESDRWHKLILGGLGSVTIMEGNTPGGDVAFAAALAEIGLVDEDAIAVLSAETDPLDDDTATLFATLAEAIVWKVDIWTLDAGAKSDVFATIGMVAASKAATGHRHEQSHGPDEAAGAAGKSDTPLVALELGSVDATDAVVSG
ncbi:MAG: hypothetical protein Q9216_006588 [Gyalolechia sp. 2 TL-2023]